MATLAPNKCRLADKSLKPQVEISECSFESFEYPSAGIMLANSSLFFADPTQFVSTWRKITSCIEVGGVFAGDFMGPNDSWAANYRLPTAPLTKDQVKSLFKTFEIVTFMELDEAGATTLGHPKHWHIFTVVAIKRE